MLIWEPVRALRCWSLFRDGQMQGGRRPCARSVLSRTRAHGPSNLLIHLIHRLSHLGFVLWRGIGALLLIATVLSASIAAAEDQATPIPAPESAEQAEPVAPSAATDQPPPVQPIPPSEPSPSAEPPVAVDQPTAEPPSAPEPQAPVEPPTQAPPPPVPPTPS